MAENFRCGYIALIGRPNAGKSTLLNRLVGEKLAITSPKPQTTRHRLLGVLNLANAQLLFLDTPGILTPHGPLNESLVQAAIAALTEADVVVWLVEPRAPTPRDQVLLPYLSALEAPLIIGINKIDTLAKPPLLPLIAAYHDLFPDSPVVPLSALAGDGLPALVGEIVQRLPLSPPFFPEEQLTDQTERFLVAEIIRERLFHHTGEEIPYAIAVAVEEFDESRRPDMVRVRAVIYVEKDSQKGIVIGKGGKLLKQVGLEAREEAERLLQSRVFLDLWVKVWKNWRKDPRALRELGYQA
jgi:GTP-binding protein Era|uniref:GTPase Era n=1 Tax=Desulfobacca acetoxidans TaxID=60893 RepID=A0A7V6A4U5_9BACT